MKKLFVKILLPIILLFVIITAIFFLVQEKILFHPQPLAADYQFRSAMEFTERNFTTADGETINALHFTTDSARGVVIYFHGNSGNIQTFAWAARPLINAGYDVLMPDYRSFGKSTGKLSENALFADAQLVYDAAIADGYPPERIVLHGYSIGTGIATYVAAHNPVGGLILEAPYYSVKNLAHRQFPWLPSFILRYPLRTDVYITDVECPVILFHGTNDEVIYYESSQKLQQHLKPGDTLITLQGASHVNIQEFDEFHLNLKNFLHKITP